MKYYFAFFLLLLFASGINSVHADDRDLKVKALFERHFSKIKSSPFSNKKSVLLVSYSPEAPEKQSDSEYFAELVGNGTRILEPFSIGRDQNIIKLGHKRGDGENTCTYETAPSDTTKLPMIFVQEGALFGHIRLQGTGWFASDKSVDARSCILNALLSFYGIELRVPDNLAPEMAIELLEQVGDWLELEKVDQ